MHDWVLSNVHHQKTWTRLFGGINGAFTGFDWTSRCFVICLGISCAFGNESQYVSGERLINLLAVPENYGLNQRRLLPCGNQAENCENEAEIPNAKDGPRSIEPWGYSNRTGSYLRNKAPENTTSSFCSSLGDTSS